MTTARPVAAAAGVYVALTLAYTWPLAAHPATGIAHDVGDPLLNTWILWWSTRALPLTSAWWNAPMFFPAPGTLAFSEHLLGLAPISAPLIALTHQPLLGYNAALIASFVLSALGAYALGYTLTHRHDAAFIAGIAYAFAPYRLAHVPHIQVLSSYWAPVCLAALHLYVRERRIRWAVLASAAWLMQALACGYYLFFLSVLFVPWVLWFAAGRLPLRRAAALAAIWTVAALVLVPILAGYQHVLHDTYGFRRLPQEIEAFSADIAGLLFAHDELLVWGWLHVTTKPESTLFPGLTIVLLLGIALFGAARHGDGRPPASRWARWFLPAFFLTFLLGALLPILNGGAWRLTIAGVRVLSIRRADKPFSLALVFGLAWLASLPRARAAIRRRSPFMFYLGAALLMWICALGPVPTLHDTRVIYEAPYRWLTRLPGFDGLRVPARFWMMALVCLSAAAGLAFNRIAERRRRVLLALVAAGMLLDGWPRAFNVVPAREPWPAPAGVSARLDLPVGDGDTLAMSQQMRAPVPLYNGYSGYFAPHYYAMRELLSERNPAILQAFASRGSLGVVVDNGSDVDGAIKAYVMRVPGAALVHAEPAWNSYRIPPRASPALPDEEGQPIQIASIDAYPSPPHAVRARDGDLWTRWSGGPQQQSSELTIELSNPGSVHQVVLDLGPYITDYPARLQIDVAAERGQWTTAWVGETALHAYFGAVRHPKQVPLVFQIDRANVRFVRLRQTGWGTHDWSVAELRVLR
jgi:hypothetical protein